MAQFAYITIKKSVLERQIQLLNEPIEDDEFYYAANLLSPAGSKTLNSGEFILLELMRLRLILPEQIEALKSRFIKFDDSKTGQIGIKEFRQKGLIEPSKNPQWLPMNVSIAKMTHEMLDPIINRTRSPSSANIYSSPKPEKPKRLRVRSQDDVELASISTPEFPSRDGLIGQRSHSMGVIRFPHDEEELSTPTHL